MNKIWVMDNKFFTLSLFFIGLLTLLLSLTGIGVIISVIVTLGLFLKWWKYEKKVYWNFSLNADGDQHIQYFYRQYIRSKNK